MTSKYLSGVLVIALSCVLCIPARADSGKVGGVGTGTIVGVVVGVVAVVAVVLIVVIHKTSGKRTITGCVRPTQNGMTVNDEKDKRAYALSGDTAGVKAGERMTLEGKKVKADASNPPGWEMTKVRTDYGVCQP